MRYLLLSVLLLVSACGFRPVYGKHYQEERGQVTAQLAEIQVMTDTSRLSQLFKAELEDRLNPEHHTGAKRYQLHVGITEQNIPLFVAQDGTYGRGNLRYTLKYTLVRTQDHQSVDRGSLVRVSSYAASETNAIYASYVAQEDAKRRGMVELANDLAMRIGNRLNDGFHAPATQDAPEPPPLSVQKIEDVFGGGVQP